MYFILLFLILECVLGINIHCFSKWGGTAVKALVKLHNSNADKVHDQMTASGINNTCFLQNLDTLLEAVKKKKAVQLQQQEEGQQEKRRVHKMYAVSFAHSFPKKSKIEPVMAKPEILRSDSKIEVKVVGN